MLSLPNFIILNQLRNEFPAGCRVELLRMDGVRAAPIGMHGTVIGVNYIGSVMVKWDNGARLSVIYNKDACRRI